MLRALKKVRMTTRMRVEGEVEMKLGSGYMGSRNVWEAFRISSSAMGSH